MIQQGKTTLELDEFTKAQPQHTESVSKSPPIIWSNELQARLCVMYCNFFHIRDFQIILNDSDSVGYSL
jgi:hypothetical protein